MYHIQLFICIKNVKKKHYLKPVFQILNNYLEFPTSPQMNKKRDRVMIRKKKTLLYLYSCEVVFLFFYIYRSILIVSVSINTKDGDRLYQLKFLLLQTRVPSHEFGK